MRGEVHPKLGSRDAAGNFKLRIPTRKEIDRARERVRRKVGHLPGLHDLTPAQIQALSAARTEAHLRRRWQAAVAEYGYNASFSQQCLRDLAVNIRDQGRHAEAFQLLPEDPKFQAGAAALDRDDNDFCSCEPDTFTRQGSGVRLQVPLYSYRPVARHDGDAYLWRCKKCGHINVSPMIPPQMRTIFERRRPGVPEDVLLRI